MIVYSGEEAVVSNVQKLIKDNCSSIEEFLGRQQEAAQRVREREHMVSGTSYQITPDAYRTLVSMALLGAVRYNQLIEEWKKWDITHTPLTL